MKKNIILFVLLTIFLLQGSVYGQSGVVKYWSINQNINYKKEFNLHFNNYESFLVYDLKPFEYETKEGYTIRSKGNYSSVYMNIKTEKGILYKQKEGKGNVSKAQIVLTKKDWLIHEEFKTILGHKVQKATLKYDYIPKASEPKGNGEIEVWFCLDIPLSLGPNVLDGNLDFVQWGLPGLILEVAYNTAWRVQAFDIQLSKEEVSFDIPEKAIEVSEEEFWQ